jgi:lysophospholipase L1-like esterase
MRLPVRNAIALTTGIAATVLLLFAVESLAGWYLFSTRQNAGLIWAPDSTVEHTTPEFHYVVHINNLGFRDRDFTRRRSARRRIAVLGDSFTYGWGLSAEQTWPKVLEARLRNAGSEVEVANLGSPGAGPAEYAELAPRVLSWLHPDVLIVAVLQADDLLQCADSARHPDPTWRQRLGAALSRILPSLSQLAGLTHADRLHVTSQDLREIWKKQVRDFAGNMNTQDRARYNLLPSRIRDMYAHGDLSPGLLYFSIRYPRFTLDTCDLGQDATRREVAEMARRLREIRDAAAHYETRTVVVSIPYRTYVSVRDIDAMRDLGFQVDLAMLQTDKPDEAIRQACERAGLAFVQVTAKLRREATDKELYFPLDGHLNALGAGTYATLLAPEIAARLR